MLTQHFTLPFLGLILIVAGLRCSGPPALTEGERSKLDARLQTLVLHSDSSASDYDMSVRKDGSREYAVIIRGSGVEALRKAGIEPGSVFGDVMTARVTVEELRRIVALPSIWSVRSSRKSSLPHSPATP